MDKKEFITAAIGLYDEIAELENKIAFADIQREIGVGVGSADKTDSDLQAIFLEARKVLLKECFYRWNEVSAKRNENGEIECTAFNVWLKSKINHVPETVSQSAFIDHFMPDLKAMYAQEKEDAIAKLTAREAEAAQEAEGAK